MLIIIEGMDRTGKSTLARRLSLDHELELTHFDKPQAHPLEEYLRPVERPFQRQVFDRYHLGERVWPGIFGRDSEYDDEMHLHVELTLQSRGAVLVRPNREWRSGELELALRDEPTNALSYRVASNRFIEEFRDTILPVKTWCLCHDSIERRGPIVYEASGRAFITGLHSTTVGGRWIGTPTPRYLLVGDQVKDPAWSLPFVPYRNTSGHFLMRELLTDDALKMSVAIVNAHKPDGTEENVRGLRDSFARRRRSGQAPAVVALGKRASSVLTAQGVQHGVTFHPQYVRRFLRRRDRGWYASEIKRGGDAA